MTNDKQPGEPDFAELANRIYRLCLALTGGANHARDAAQESLMRAWARRERRKSGVSWWSWTAGFAVRICRERRRTATHGFATLDAIDEANATIAGAPMDATWPESTRQAIDALPPRQRDVLLLRMIVGQSTREAAETLGCPEGTIKSNLNLAIRSLRSRMATNDERNNLHSL